MKEIHQQIEQYVNGEMTEAERMAFNEKLKHDAVLSEQVALYRQADQALSDEKLLDFAEMLEAVKSEYHESEENKPRQKVRNFKSYFLYGIAASLLLIVSTLLFWPKPDVDTLTWYEANYSPYPAQVQRSTGDGYPEKLDQALSAYRNQQYDLAIELIQPYRTTPPYGAMADFYTAQALMATNRLEEANIMWEQMLSGEASVYRQSVQWYLALSYVRLGELGKARELASEITQIPQHAYGRKAEILLENFPD